MHLLSLDKVVGRVEMRLANDNKVDKALPWFDHTKLSAINTCPMWGMMHYVARKQLPGNSRAMALEAGTASHEVYAAVRLFDLAIYQGLPNHATYHGERIFGAKRWQRMLDKYIEYQDADARTCSTNFCLQALYDSGFYDDPYDKRRTMTNIEEGCIAYLDQWPWGKYPIWVEDENDPSKQVGIEIAVDFVIEFYCARTDKLLCAYRYIGRGDGLHHHGEHMKMHENKTASRLNDAWVMSFRMSHQITGYCVGVSLKTGQAVNNARVHGMAIPLPRSYDYGGIIYEDVPRHDYHIRAWLHWVWDTTRIYEQFKDNIDGSTRFTHSCNRYFRPCSMIPYCDNEDEERKLILNEEMVATHWHPLEGQASD